MPTTKPRIGIEDIAELCHEANRALCRADGDTTQLPWKDAATWQAEAAIQNVKLHLDPTNDNPEQAHLVWCKEKLDAGWVYGPVKNAITKQHPCLVPYHDLSVIDRAKDHVFVSVVKVFREHYDIIEGSIRDA